jgi:hypothetical protein
MNTFQPPTFTTDRFVISATAHLVQAARTHKNPELEARFGKMSSDGYFEPGVSADFFSQSVQACENWEGWNSVREWTSSTDFAYQVGSEWVRTTRTGQTIAHMAKQSISRCDLGLESSTSSTVPHMMRVSLSTETPKSAEELPDTVMPVLIRDKTRKSFSFGAWRFDFTRVFEGSNRAEIDEAQKAGLERFEIEVECAEFSAYSAMHTDAYIAESLCMKMADFIDAPTVKVTSSAA